MAIMIVAIFPQMSLLAQLPQARLDTVFPPGGKQGNEVQVSLTGEHLDGLRQLLFSHPGIQSDINPDAPTSNATPSSFRVAISDDVPPGHYEVRTAGYFGVSNPRTFVIGSHTEITKQGKPHRADQAMDLPLETIVNGTTDPQAMDHYSVILNAGSTYAIECVAASIDSRLSPLMILIDPESKESARTRSGGLIHFIAQRTGPHIIRLHDALYQGGTHYYYRLKTSTLTSTESHQLLPENIRRKPGDVEINVHDKRVGRTVGISGPQFRAFISKASVEEQEPNNTPEQAQLIQVPCELSGRFESNQDVDRFQFEAKKGEMWWMEVISDRIGQPTSPFLLVQRMDANAEHPIKLHTVREVYAQTKNPLGRQLDLTHRDPVWRFEAPQDGFYQLRLSDLFRHAETPHTFAYRIIIRKPKPDFTLIALSSHAKQINNDSRVIQPSETSLRRGMTWPLELAVLRRDGFNGSIKVQATDLPEGVTSQPGWIADGEDRGWIFLTASTNAPASWTSIKIQGHATIDAKEMTHEAQSATTIWTVDDYNNQPLEQRLTAAQWLATHAEETSPIIIAPSKTNIRASNGQKVDIPLTVTWNEGAEAAFKIKPVGIPSADKLPELEIKPPETQYTYSLKLADLKIPDGNYPLSWSGLTKIKYRNQAQAADWFNTQLQETDNKLNKAKSALKSAEDNVAQIGDDPGRKQEAERQLATARMALKEAESAHATLAQQAKEAEERAKPRDVDYMVYASPIMIEWSSAHPQEEDK